MLTNDVIQITQTALSLTVLEGLLSLVKMTRTGLLCSWWRDGLCGSLVTCCGASQRAGSGECNKLWRVASTHRNRSWSQLLLRVLGG